MGVEHGASSPGSDTLWYALPEIHTADQIRTSKKNIQWLMLLMKRDPWVKSLNTHQASVAQTKCFVIKAELKV